MMDKTYPVIERAPTLAERAQAAWRSQRAAMADERAKRIAAHRQNLIEHANELVQRCLEVYDHAYPVKITSTDEEMDGGFYRGTAELTIDGERFEVLYNDAFDGWGLYHRWTCPACGEEAEDLTANNHIESLADLGFWLEQASATHAPDCVGEAPHA